MSPDGHITLPDRALFRQLARPGAVIPVYRELMADVETPFSAYCKLREGAGLLLESVERGENVGRYSYVASNLRKIDAAEPFSAIRDAVATTTVELPGVDLPPFRGGTVGYLSYETASLCEPTVPRAVRDALDLPDAVLLAVDALLAFDHVRHRLFAVTHVRIDGDVDAAYNRAVQRIDEICDRLAQPFSGLIAPSIPAVTETADPLLGAMSNMLPEQFQRMVEQCKEQIAAGEAIQIVVSQRFSRSVSAGPLSVYRALRSVNPAPYTFLLETDEDDLALIGASPELLVQVRDGVATTHPIAGTRPRGETPEIDLEMEAELRADEKEQAEHVMLVDLGRNDLGRVCAAGSVEVPHLMEVERYSHVMHLVSHVTGVLRDDCDAVDALRACFPAGTVSGAPKVRAMQLIAELEGETRGTYAGAVVCAGFDGALDAAISIRCIALAGGIAHVQTGAGVVADSVPEREHAESVNKARGMLQALQLADDLSAQTHAAAEVSR
jgi:anthranilate synthase component 1